MERGGEPGARWGIAVRARTDLRVRGRRGVKHEGEGVAVSALAARAARAATMSIKEHAERFSCVS